MAIYGDRKELLHALQSMGIEFPSKTNLSADDLDTRLKKALYLSQRMDAKLKGIRLLDVSSLRDWSSVSSVCGVLEAQSTEEEIGASHYLASWAMRMRRLDNHVFVDLENTIMFLARAFDNKVTTNLLKGERDGYVIMIRVVKVCAVDENTPLFVVWYDSKPWSLCAESLITNIAPGHSCSVAEQKLLLKVLENNRKRLNRDYEPDCVPFYESHFKLSFILPLKPLSVASIGSLSDIGCTTCGRKTKLKCDQCYAISYCGTGCQRIDWPSHKRICKPLAEGISIDLDFHVLAIRESFRRDTLTEMRGAPDRLKQNREEECGSHDQVFRGQNDPDCRLPEPNIHGDKPFLVKIQVPSGYFSKDRRSTGSIRIYDRRMSLDAHFLQRSDPQKFSFLEIVTGNMDKAGYELYRWAKRIGDWQLRICIDREPETDIIW